MTQRMKERSLLVGVAVGLLCALGLWRLDDRSVDSVYATPAGAATEQQGAADHVADATVAAAAGLARNDEAAPGALDPGSLPFDLGAVMEQVHFAYRRSEATGRFEGGHTTYSVAADGRELSLRAYHSPGSPDEREHYSDPRVEPTPRLEREVRESAELTLKVVALSRGAGAPTRAAAEPTVAHDGHLTIARGAVTEHLRNGDEGVEQSWSFDEKPLGTGDLVVRIAANGMHYVGATNSGLHFADASGGEASGLGFSYGHGKWIDATGRQTAVLARWTQGAIELRIPADVVDGTTYPAVLDPTISPELGMDDSVPAPVSGADDVRVASNGTDYFAVWTDGRTGLGSWIGVYGTRVSSSGVILDPVGFPIAIGRSQREPSVASNGSDYFVAWADLRNGTNFDVYGSRVTSSGAVTDPVGIAISTAANDQRAPSVASNGIDYLVAWQDTRINSLTDIYAARVTSGGVVREALGIALSLATNAQVTPAAASSGTDYLVVWEDARSGTAKDIYGTRVTSGGGVVDTAGIAISTAAADQSAPAVASNGSDYLVVWQDLRVAGDFNVYGTRVTNAGVVTNPTGLAVSVVPGSHQYGPGVASSGADFLVAWGDQRASLSDVYGTRITSAGVVVDAAGLPLCTAAANQQLPSIASNGTDYLLTWEDDRNLLASQYSVYGTRVTNAGTVLDVGGVPISLTAYLQQAASVSTNGSNFLVAWQDRRGILDWDIYGARVSPGGVILDPTGIVISTAPKHQSSPRIASNGSDYLVVWGDERGGTNSDIYGTRVTGAGIVLDPGGLAISAAPNYQDSPSVASAGSGYLVVWADYRSGSGHDIYGTRVANTGALLDATGLAISAGPSEQTRPAVASTGTEYLVVWQDYRSPPVDIYGARVTTGGVVIDSGGILVSTAGGGQSVPDVASNGTDYLVVWQDYRSSTTYDIYGTSVTSAGAVVHAAGIPISTASNNQTFPRAASDGTSYLVVWEDLRAGSTTDVYGTRVTGTGTVESSSGIAFAADGATNETGPAVSGGPSDTYLVVYDRFIVEAPFGNGRTRGRLVQYGSIRGAACGTGTNCESGFCVDGVCCESACGGAATNDCQACSTAAGSAVNGTCGSTTGNSCSDGLGCTQSEACTAGVCTAGATSPCNGSTTCSEAGGGGYACSVCPAGTHSVDGTGATACLACAAGTWSAPGATVCSAWTACAAGTYVSAGGTVASDRVCSACVSGTFSTTPNAASCTAWTTCSIGSYVANAGSSTSDRACAACAAGTYASMTNASACTAWSSCSAGTYVATGGTSASDRVCNVCGAGYSTTTNASACTGWTTCSAGNYIANAGTTTGDRICAGCASGSYSTSTNASTCTAWSACPAGTYIAATGTSTSDQLCAACASGSYSTTTNATSCTGWSTCLPGTSVASAGTVASDRTCTGCVSGKFSTTANAALCAGWSTCSAGTYVAGAGTSTSDRACASCGSGTYSVATNALSCAGWSNCPAGSYVVGGGTSTGDRICAGCSVGTYSTTQNAATCTGATTCVAGSYVATAGTSTSDRVCAACGSGTYSAMPDLVSCSVWTDCLPGTRLSAPGTPTSDRGCVSCASGTYSTASNASVCDPWTACGVAEYESTAPTVSSNRVCVALTACGVGEYESTAPTAISNRMCRACTLCGPGTREVTPCTATTDTLCENLIDSGVPDGGAPDDAAVPDGGVVDASMPPDAAAVDGSAIDASVASDAASVDAEGADASANPPKVGGCTCSVAGAPWHATDSSAVFGAIAIVAAMARRRRARC